MDSNGYNKSILNTHPGLCFLCGQRCETARHEIYPGATRKICKRMGLWINVCPSCHSRIHAGGAEWLKEYTERAFLEQGGTMEEWMDRKNGIGKNYL